MMGLGAYEFIIAGSLVIIVSFIFNYLSDKTSIPSVLMLIVLGIGIKEVFNIQVTEELSRSLEIVGIVGLIMIVLEAALELELTREKVPLILKSVAVALLGLLASAFSCAYILQQFIPDIKFLEALLYATPLSILSSAIIIPSVGKLREDKKEFHIYESTFSDILGIMMFYFVENLIHPESTGENPVVSFGISFALTLVIAFGASYILVFLFQQIRSHVKLFLLISILLLIYSIGKIYHLSPLIIILVFGLVLSNYKLFFRGRINNWLKEKNWLNEKTVQHINDELHVITIETAFVIRTFFFVIFGLTIALTTLANPDVWLISGIILVSIYLIRYILLRFFVGKDINPQVFIGPRGLITVLLFFSIPVDMQVEGFEPGILLFIIIATNIVMTIFLIRDSSQQALEAASFRREDGVSSAGEVYKSFDPKVSKE